MQALLYAFNPKNVFAEFIDVLKESSWGRWFIPLCSLLIIYLSMGWGSAWWEILSAVSGVFCVVLVAERKLTNFFWGLINCSLYGLTSFFNAFYGDMSLNWLVYVPFQFLGLMAWYQKSGTDDTATRSLGLGYTLIAGVLAVASIGATGLILSILNGAHPFADATNVILSLLATLLMWRRYTEQWICWILVNLSGILMWSLSLWSGQGDGLPALLMWGAFLANSIYGYLSWRRAETSEAAILS